MRTFWPVQEAAQADYEALREAALAGLALIGVAAGRFERVGLAGLVVRPAADPVFTASLTGAVRPPWTPYVDPRAEALAAGYSLLLDALDRRDWDQAALMAGQGGRQ
jgi:hypothetical protein